MSAARQSGHKVASDYKAILRNGRWFSSLSEDLQDGLVRSNKITSEEGLANADSATNLGLLLGNSGIMPAAGDRAKKPMPGAMPGGPSFGDFKITEYSEQGLG